MKSEAINTYIDAIVDGSERDKKPDEEINRDLRLDTTLALWEIALQLAILNER